MHKFSLDPIDKKNPFLVCSFSWSPYVFHDQPNYPNWRATYWAYFSFSSSWGISKKKGMATVAGQNAPQIYLIFFQENKQKIKLNAGLYTW